jgi:hypothetical protein
MFTISYVLSRGKRPPLLPNQLQLPLLQNLHQRPLLPRRLQWRHRLQHQPQEVAPLLFHLPGQELVMEKWKDQSMQSSKNQDKSPGHIAG